MGSKGADNGGDSLAVGRTNKSEVRTILVAFNGEDDPKYKEDFVLDVSSVDNALEVDNPKGPDLKNGVDAIHATGTVPTSQSTGGPIPAGNGVVGRGLNGLVGYVHGPPRARSFERDVHAGVLGVGDGASNGVFGRGLNGVVGLERATLRDTAFEAQERAGVLGRGEIGVSGDGVNGPGVHGRGIPGVRGEAPGIGPGVLGEGETGVIAEGRDGPGILASSKQEQAGVFQTAAKRAQVWLIPLDKNVKDPGQLRGEPGELLVLLAEDERGTEVASLWFCTIGGGPGQASQANWKKLA
jgi:hypothetical protein